MKLACFHLKLLPLHTCWFAGQLEVAKLREQAAAQAAAAAALEDRLADLADELADARCGAGQSDLPFGILDNTDSGSRIVLGAHVQLASQVFVCFVKSETPPTVEHYRQYVTGALWF